MKLQSILQNEAPGARESKHKEIVMQLMRDLEQLSTDSALKVPLADLPDSKENIRAALSRAMRKRGISIATSSDSQHLYVWRISPKP